MSKTVFITILACFASTLCSSALAVRVMEYEGALDITTSQERAPCPTALTRNPVTGEICVTDAQYSRFHVFNQSGVETFKTGGFSRLSSPSDGSITSNGDFVFIDKGEHRRPTIRRLNFMGEPMEFVPEPPLEKWSPRHLAITQDNHILTVDSNNNVLVKHDSKTGAVLWLTEVTGDGLTELQLGRVVEAPDGRIYLPSGILHNVTVFSASGERLKAFGRFGTGPGKMVFPVGTAIGPENSILVLDRMRHKVLMFAPDHRLLGEFGRMGAGLGQFYHPTAIAASEDGKVYVAQGYGSRVQVFSIRDTKAE